MISLSQLNKLVATSREKKTHKMLNLNYKPTSTTIHVQNMKQCKKKIDHDINKVLI